MRKLDVKKRAMFYAMTLTKKLKVEVNESCF